MKTRFQFLMASCLMTFVVLFATTSCGSAVCDDPSNIALCKSACDDVVHVSSMTWTHNAGDDFFTIDVVFDKDVDANASGFSAGNGFVVYKRPAAVSSGGTTLAGTVSGSGTRYTWRSGTLGETVITDPLNFFEIAVESNIDGVISTNGGIFDNDTDCKNGGGDLREFKQF